MSGRKIRVFRQRNLRHAEYPRHDRRWCVMVMGEGVDDTETRWFASWDEAIIVATATAPVVATAPERKPYVRVTDEMRGHILRMHDGGAHVNAIAREFDVTPQTVRNQLAKRVAA
jgi:hypothetical protein